MIKYGVLLVAVFAAIVAVNEVYYRENLGSFIEAKRGIVPCNAVCKASVEMHQGVVGIERWLSRQLGGR